MLNSDDDTLELPVTTGETPSEAFKAKFADRLEPTTENRAEFLRWLCQGEGMTRDKLEDHILISEPLFGSKDPETVISSAYWTLVPSEFRDAIGNALGIDFEGPAVLRGTLSDRRDFFRKQRGISPRTVIRHEEKGAELLAKQIDVTPGPAKGQKIVRLMLDRMSDDEIKSLIASIPRLAAIAEKFGSD